MNQDEVLSTPISDVPTLQLRWLFGVALLVPMMLATGVFWLHMSLQTRTGPQAAGGVFEVTLVTPPSQMDEPRQAASQLPTPPIEAIQPVLEQQATLEPETEVQPWPAQVAPVIPPAARTDPGTSLTSGAKANSRTASAFQRTLFAHIAHFRNYPEQALLEKMQGTVQVLFAMRRNGTVTDLFVQKSSGHEELDAAAVATIRRAQPLPSIPPALPDNLTILIPVAFNLP